MSASESLGKVLRDPDIYGQPAGTPVWPTELAARILADPAPLLAALPDDVLIEALVRRGVLAVEWGTGRPPEWAWQEVDR